MNNREQTFPILQDLLEYSKTGLAGSRILEIEQMLGRNLRRACHIILGWLYGQAEIRQQRPLLLPRNTEWARDVQQLIATDKDLSDLFAVTNGKLDYHETILLEQRLEIQRRVHGRYTPKHPVFEPDRKPRLLT